MDSHSGVSDTTLAEILAPPAAAKLARKSRPGLWECIEYTGKPTPDGYGIFTLPGETRPFAVHRVAWMMHHRTRVPEDLVVDHLCCNRICINAEHLEAVTATVNGLRVTTPAPGWVQVSTKKYGIRRRRRTSPDELAARRVERRKTLALPPPLLFECEGKFRVLWKEWPTDGSRLKERIASFATENEAADFLSELSA